MAPVSLKLRPRGGRDDMMAWILFFSFFLFLFSSFSWDVVLTSWRGCTVVFIMLAVCACVRNLLKCFVFRVSREPEADQSPGFGISRAYESRSDSPQRTRCPEIPFFVFVRSSSDFLCRSPAMRFAVTRPTSQEAGRDARQRAA